MTTAVPLEQLTDTALNCFMFHVSFFFSNSICVSLVCKIPFPRDAARAHICFVEGLGPRLGGSLAYILPLTEAFKFMLPLVQQFPPLGVIFGPITLLTVLLNTIPFIPLILFVTYIICAQVKDP